MAGLRCEHDTGTALRDNLAKFFQNERGAVDLEDGLGCRLRRPYVGGMIGSERGTART